MSKQILLFLSALMLALSLPAAAKDAVPLAEDEAVEKRLNIIAEEMRCLVCQNESLAGSRSDLAMDLRREIRTLIKEGKSDEQVMEFMVSRYGDFVRYRPPVKPTTYVLWIGPFLLLIAGIIALVAYLRRRGKAVAAPSPLTEEERRRAEALLKNADQ